ncbi:MAG TPA: HigA family addiction module antitoxin [Candidatus Babeliaceae bacterium]|nr:HigA family addiction module antitoxin [Candidatus Babeliaceae bacterium]
MKHRNIHPGEILKEEFLKPYNITPYRAAIDINVPVTRIYEICSYKRSITPDTAIRLARYFGTTPQFWMNLQSSYNLEKTLSNTFNRNKEEYEKIIPLKDIR